VKICCKGRKEDFLLFSVYEVSFRHKETLKVHFKEKEKYMEGKKTAIVTGASRGIGLAVARQLGLDGYQVVLFATRPASACEEQLKELDGAGITWHYVQGTLDSSQDRKRLVQEAVRRFGRIDVLVNNAGVAPLVRGDLLTMTEESYDRVMGINAKGTMFLTQLVANQMLKQEILGKKRGTIVNIGSCSAEVSSVNRGEYCISKSALTMMTTLFADRLAGDGILVHEVRPGVIKTDMTGKVQEKYDALIEAGAFPIRRWGTVQDVADAVSAFCSDLFLYTTGNYIDVDGGFHIKRL
jgi:3-oxoacyl-[acyl-carrier protein] reductase